MRIRFTVRRLMLLAAIAALAMAGVIMVNRAAGFRALAEDQRFDEMMSHAYADDARGPSGDKERLARGEQKVEYHRKLKIKYERAARHPWLRVEPDSPIPDPEEQVTERTME